MSNPEKLREEILAIVTSAGVPLTSAVILDQAEHADDKEQFSHLLYTMSKSGELRKHSAPEGSGAGVRFLYGVGDGTPRQMHAGGGTRSEGRELAPAGSGGGSSVEGKTRKRRAKGGHKKRRRRLHKVQRKTAASRAKPTRPTRWALTSDGAFVLLGTKIEIPHAAARPLIELVRHTGGAIQTATLFGELAVFIEKLDKGQA